VLAHESFRAGQYDTDFVQRLQAEQAEQKAEPGAPRESAPP
jgi:hypothetical protein